MDHLISTLTMRDVADLITAISALGACILSALNRNKIDRVHLDINSRMDQLLRTSIDEAVGRGRQQQRDDDASRPKP